MRSSIIIQHLHHFQVLTRKHLSSLQLPVILIETKTVIVEKIQMPDGGEKVITKIIKSEDKNGD